MRIPASSAALLLLGLALAGLALSDHPFLGGEPGIGRFQVALVVTGLGIAATSMLRPKVRTRLLTAIIATVMSLAAAEVLVDRTVGHHIRTPFEYDDELLFRLRADSRGVFLHDNVNGGHSVVSHVNADGFRGAPLLPRGGQFRVLVYGDSFIHAMYTAEEHTFTRRLQEHLTQLTSREVEVVNAGISSYGPDQAALKMARELPTHEPDLVILGVFTGNDFGDIERNKLFRLDDDGSFRRNPDAYLAPHLRRRLDLARRESILKSALRKAWKARRSSTALPADIREATDLDTAYVEHWLQVALEEHEDYAIKMNDEVMNIHVDFYNADVALLPNSPSARHRRALMRGALDLVQSITDDAGVQLLVLAIPHPLDACAAYDTGRVDLDRYPEYRRENLTEAVMTVCEELRITGLDLFALFSESGCDELFLRGGDDHWSDAGQALAASFVSEHIRELNLLQSQDR